MDLTSLLTLLFGNADPVGSGPDLADLIAQRLAAGPYQGSPDRGQLGRMERDTDYWSRMGADSPSATRHMVRRDYVVNDAFAKRGAAPLDDRVRRSGYYGVTPGTVR